jgi:hypothetical protein
MMLSIHLEGKKVVLAADRVEAGRKVDLPSRLERYFGRPMGLAYDGLRYTDYYAHYYLVSEERSENGQSDECIPPHICISGKRRSFASSMESTSEMPNYMLCTSC